jgi:hypothetical protein
MASPPLTHHEIISLVEPFTRRGRHVDLAASDRLARTLRFRPVLHAAQSTALPALTEILQLDHPAQGKFRLTRLLAPATGPAASLVAEGPDVGTLLANLESIAPAQQLRTRDGFVIATSHRLEVGTGAAAPRLLLTRGVAWIDDLVLTLKMPSVRGMPGDLELATTGAAIDFPEDLLAVLGWRWTRLIRGEDVWRGSVRLRGNGAARGRDAEGKLETAAAHLARTLAEPPARFHQRRVLARWGVFARRAIPLLAVIALIAGGIAIPSLNLSQESVIRMLIFNSPPLLMILVFGMREVPRIEIPPLPRASSAPAWRPASPDTGGHPDQDQPTT